jgi:hypothetical protein
MRRRRRGSKKEHSLLLKAAKILVSLGASVNLTLGCQVAEHCWDPVGHAIATYGYLFEGLIWARQREV